MSRPFDPAAFAAARRRGYIPNAELRVSDAERHEIAEILSRHYADGRLDDAEFNERVSKAMAAKTRGDLAGLLTDLPPLEGEEHPAIAAGPRPHPLRLVALVAVVFLLFGALQGPFFPFWHLHLGFLAFVVLAVVLIRRRSMWSRHSGSVSS